MSINTRPIESYQSREIAYRMRIQTDVTRLIPGVSLQLADIPMTTRYVHIVENGKPEPIATVDWELDGSEDRVVYVDSAGISRDSNGRLYELDAVHPIALEE